MIKSELSLRERVQRLRRTFLDRIPESVAAGRTLCDRLAANPSSADLLADLHRTFHSLKGTAASFGLEAISAAAAGGEASLAPFSDGSVGGAPTAGTLAGVRTALDHIAALVGTTEDSDGIGDLDFGLPVKVSDATRPQRSVFVCDDDELDVARLGAQLACFGYKVTTFASTEALKAAVDLDAPDAIVMDIVFPNGTNAGPETISGFVHSMRFPPPVVFISARNDFEARLKSVQAGGQAYYTKPIKADELVETLDLLTSRQEPEPYRILVVDDEPTVAEYHSLILREAGMITRLLPEPDSILDVLADFRPDLVLMDMYMPRCTGRELSQVIRQIPDFVSLPIVFLSVETNKVKQSSAMKIGAEGFLTKPIQPDDLINAVATRAERMRTLRSLMVQDGLTGLFNHTFVSQYLDTALATAKRDRGQVTWVMLDVDHFKAINDTHGHLAGDRVLVALARLLRQRLRNSDLVARFGGEEFAVVMRNVDADNARAIIDRLREDFSHVIFRSGDNGFSCSFSGGIASYPDLSNADLVEAADRALYAAKHAGRNCIRVARNGEVL